MSSPPPLPPKDIPPRRSSLERQERQEKYEPRPRQRSGYTRPYPPPAFSSSAMHRHSVLALGKIEHLQHYFAVSGKLDKKGANYAPSKAHQKPDSTHSSRGGSPEALEQELFLPPERDSTSPTPTAPKPVSLKQTRSELLNALTECEQALLQDTGIEIVDSATATIRLAHKYRAQVKNEDLEDEKRLRKDAMDILFHLKRMAERDGLDVTVEEKSVIHAWCKEVRLRVQKDDELRRGMWEQASKWMYGNWTDREWDRYYLFLQQFDSTEPKLPSTSTSGFYDIIRPGTRLCLIHNACTHFSRRPFGLITRYHSDTTVQYRVTDNLKFFAKAAEIRWELELQWDVEEIWRATPKGDAMLKSELGKWCETVIQELIKIYHEEIKEGEDELDELMNELGKEKRGEA